MSIVAMKRKALRKPLSSGTSGFSINGGYRNTGGITRTPVVIRNGSKCSANDSNVIKPSVKTSKGHMAKKMICCKDVDAGRPLYSPKKEQQDHGEKYQPRSQNSGLYGLILFLHQVMYLSQPQFKTLTLTPIQVHFGNTLCFLDILLWYFSFLEFGLD